MTASTGALFRKMVSYLDIPLSSPKGNIIINNQNGLPVQRPVELPAALPSTVGGWLGIMAYVNSAVFVVFEFLQNIRRVTPDLEAVNYLKHANALKEIQAYKSLQTEIDKNTLSEPTPEQLERKILNNEVIDAYEQVVRQNCGRAGRLLPAIAGFAGAAFTHEVMSPHKILAGKVSALRSAVSAQFTKTPGLAQDVLAYAVESSPVGTKHMKIAMAVSAGFALLSMGWHKLRTPSMKNYEQVIIDRSGLRPCKCNGQAG